MVRFDGRAVRGRDVRAGTGDIKPVAGAVGRQCIPVQGNRGTVQGRRRMRTAARRGDDGTGTCYYSAVIGLYARCARSRGSYLRLGQGDDTSRTRRTIQISGDDTDGALAADVYGGTVHRGLPRQNVAIARVRPHARRIGAAGGYAAAGDRTTVV